MRYLSGKCELTKDHEDGQRDAAVVMEAAGGILHLHLCVRCTLHLMRSVFFRQELYPLPCTREWNHL